MTNKNCCSGFIFLKIVAFYADNNILWNAKNARKILSEH